MAKTMEEVLERFRTIEFHEDFDMIVAIANGGIVPAGIINQRLQERSTSLAHQFERRIPASKV